METHNAEVLGLLLQSYSMGILMFVQTMLLVSYGHLFLSDSYGDLAPPRMSFLLCVDRFRPQEVDAISPKPLILDGALLRSTPDPISQALSPVGGWQNHV